MIFLIFNTWTLSVALGKRLQWQAASFAKEDYWENGYLWDWWKKIWNYQRGSKFSNLTFIAYCFCAPKVIWNDF